MGLVGPPTCGACPSPQVRWNRGCSGWMELDAGALPPARLLWPLGRVPHGGGRNQGRGWHLLEGVEGTKLGIPYQQCCLGGAWSPLGPARG